MAENCGHLKLVSLEKYGFVLDPRYHWEGWTPSPEILGRDTAVLALVSAKASLPPNWNFKIWDMHRTREVQIRMIRSFRDRIRAEHPEWGELTVMRGVYKFAAKAKRVVLRPDCHRNGGAVDLTIVDDSGREIDMGTDHDDLSERARSTTLSAFQVWKGTIDLSY